MQNHLVRFHLYLNWRILQKRCRPLSRYLGNPLTALEMVWPFQILKDIERASTMDESDGGGKHSKITPSRGGLLEPAPYTHKRLGECDRTSLYRTYLTVYTKSCEISITPNLYPFYRLYKSKCIALSAFSFYSLIAFLSETHQNPFLRRGHLLSYDFSSSDSTKILSAVFVILLLLYYYVFAQTRGIT